MKAIIGIILFCLLVLLSSFIFKTFTTNSIEGNLRDKTEKVLEDHNIDTAGLSFDGHHIDEAFASKLPSEVRDELDGVIGMYIPEANEEPAPAAAPVEYTDVDFKAARVADKIVATGVLPNEEEQSKLIKMLKDNSGGLEVIDKTTLAENPTPKVWWKGKPSAFIPALFEGSKGDAFAHYMPKDFKASGEFTQEGPFNALNSSIALPEGIANKANLVYNKPAPARAPAPAPKPEPKPEPAPLKDPEFYMTESKEGALVLRGTVDSEETKAALIKSAKSTIPAGSKISFTENVKVVENTAQIGDLPKVEELLSTHINKAAQAEMDYTPKKMRLRGALANKNEMKNLLSMSKPLRGKRSFKNELTVPAPAAPAPKPDDLMKDLSLLPVYFDTSSSAIKKSEEGKIVKAAEAIKKSAAKDMLTVGGYADQRGNAEFNKNLSLQRANAVKDRLIKLGVSGDRLKVNHFGEDTSNMAKDDLWKARRVAITLTPKK